MSKMRSEILSQGKVLAEAIPQQLHDAEAVRTVLGGQPIRFISLVARGTSDHAAIYGQYLLQYANGLPAGLATPSIHTLYNKQLHMEGGLVVGISQSGQGTDVIETIEQARAAGASTIAITNDLSSPLAEAAQLTIGCYAGPEESVAATKTFTTSLSALVCLSQALGAPEELLEGFQELPEKVDATLATLDEPLGQFAATLKDADKLISLGRGFQQPVAFETALKLKETCYVHAWGMSSADFLHGPIAIVEDDLPVLMFGASGPTSPMQVELLQRLQKIGANLAVFGADQNLLSNAKVAFPIGKDVAEPLLPLLTVLGGQLLSCHLAEVKGINPDKPRGLQKVTKTR
ncbi:MAG: SIS domain-containing protein [Firmicutes bacterium]|nr:SIS domain-containing protein [Bacillota bacterium]HQD40836.1 SIS domain-containing protein [Bacillota bacterium]